MKSKILFYFKILWRAICISRKEKAGDFYMIISIRTADYL
jgi:hypothetical protein